MSRVFLGLMGAFLAVWGTWELLEMLGWVAQVRFPWPLMVLLVGAGMLVGAATGRGWGWGWGCGEAAERPRDPGRGP